MGKTIAAVIPTFDDLEVSSIAIPYACQWADQVVVLDGGSTDGTLDFLEFFARNQRKLTVRRMAANEALTRGFDWLRNEAASFARTDWIFAMDADTIVEPTETDYLRGVIGSTRDRVLGLTRINLLPDGEPSTALMRWMQLTTNPVCCRETEPKFWIHRRMNGYAFKGFIHEELRYHGGAATGPMLKLTLWHLAHLKSEQLRRRKSLRLAYLYSELAKNPLQCEGINGYWFQSFYPANKEQIEADAREYRRIHGK